jgi:CDP-diacylglycerol---serine O-phosphatidyltransferase
VKKIAIIPTLCTLGNAACGFSAIVVAAKVNLADGLSDGWPLYISGWLIFAAMLFDVFDGYLARRSKTSSQFGAELDSLCDAISFGAAPGFLIIQMGAGFGPELVQELFLGTATLYMVCALLRLARFNVQTSLDAKAHRYFKGLPSPAAAGCIASLVVAHHKFAQLAWLPPALLDAMVHWLAPLIGLLVALLMVSRVPYVHFVNRLLHRRHTFGQLMQLILAVFAIWLFRELALMLLFWYFAFATPVRMLLNRQGATALANSLSGEDAPPARDLGSQP